MSVLNRVVNWKTIIYLQYTYKVALINLRVQIEEEKNMKLIIFPLMTLEN